MKDLGVYIHIPFCKSRCAYCAFVSSTLGDIEQNRYVTAVTRELSYRAKTLPDRIVRTVYFGGGTPSILPHGGIARILNAIREELVCEIEEITVECNPADINEELCAEYIACGVTRLSMGVQSTDCDTLKLLGRRSSVAEIQSALTVASRYFDNISVDVMLGLPNENQSTILATLDYLTSFEQVKHISAYTLTLEENTPLEDMVKGGLSIPDDDAVASTYEFVRVYLSAKGYNRYEISNFAKAGYESKHNSSYWSRREYLGLGVAAHSLIDEVRLANTENIGQYLVAADKGDFEYESREELDARAQIEEVIMLSLRTSKGIDLELLKRKYDYDLLAVKSKEIAALHDILLIDDHLRLAEDKMEISNAVIVQLI